MTEAAADGHGADGGIGRRRAVALAAYVVFVIGWWKVNGLPLERLQVLGWVAGGLLIASVGRPDGGLVRIVRDWVPLAVILAAYDLTRGVADTLGMPVQRESLVRLEQIVAWGNIPSVVAQERLGPYTGPVRWWEVGVSLVYLSHFVVPFVVLGALWVADRPGFRRYRNALLVLTAMGLLTYVLVPAAPPWMASRDGLIGPISRVVLRGMDPFGLDLGPVLVRYGPRFGNAVAALPSLHAGWSTLTALFFARRTRRRWWPLLASYPLAMSVALVVSGEHYVFDVLLGAAYAAVAVGIEQAWHRRSVRRAAERARFATAPVGPPASAAEQPG